MRLGAHLRGVRQKYGSLVNCIADLLGPHAEVVLHDTSHADHSIVMIRNGQVTGRSVGAPLTDLGFYMLRESARRIETLGVYQGKTDNGKLLRCNAVNLRNSQGKIEAILCINIDVNGDNLSSVGKNDLQFKEHYQTSINQVIDSQIAEASGGQAGDLAAEAKFEVICELESRGIFLARGSVKQVAASLNIATPTVYKYIKLARRKKAVMEHHSKVRPAKQARLNNPKQISRNRSGSLPRQEARR